MMPGRDRSSCTVVASLENAEGNRCVDLFTRPDGSWGFEEYRSDPEDGGAWTRVGNYAHGIHATRAAAEAAAVEAVAWLADAQRGHGQAAPQ
jgi:hypothetical protein